jgi:two-component system, NtrC family, sensor kinase
MAVCPHDVAALLQRARRACADIATVRDEIALTLAETRRLLTEVRSEDTATLPVHRIVADATADQLERMDQEGPERARLAAQLAATKATARAVAHALNQPLAVIRGITELIQTAPQDNPFAPDLAQIAAATDRAAAVVRDLVRVARYSTQLAADGNPMLDMSTAIDPPMLME